MSGSDSDHEGGAEGQGDGPDQVEHLNKNLLLAFKSHLEKADLKGIPHNQSLDDPADDDAWKSEDEEMDEASRQEVRFPSPSCLSAS